MHSAIAVEAIEHHQNRAEMMQLTDDPSHSTLDGLINESDPLALATGKSDNEVFNLKQVMAQDDRDCFVKAMEKEINGHLEGNYWKVVRRSDHNFPSIIKAI